MRIVRIDYDNIINGPGQRAVLWTQGCNHYCEECHNKESWNPNGGRDLTEEDIDELEKYLRRDYVDGVTITGGDPLYKGNRREVLDLCRRLARTGKTIWLYTGYTYEQLIKELTFTEMVSLQYITVLVDGPYEKDKKVYNEFRGSSNQRFIIVTMSSYNKVVEWHSQFENVK